MSITDELRKWVTGAKPAVVDGCSISVGTMTYGCKKALLAIADRIDAEHEAQLNDAFETRNSDENLESDGWVRLPKDADGVPIHAGDTLDGYGKTIEVVEMRHGRGWWVLISRDGNGYADTFAFAHHHEPTVEDVLRDYASRILIAGCIDEEDELVAEYAAKLRLAESEDA